MDYTNILNKLPYQSMMSLSKYNVSWVCNLIKTYKPKRILEVGVSTGGSTAVYLNCIKDMDSELISVDCCTHADYKPGKPKIGSEVYDLSEYLDLSKFTLYTGKLLPEIVDKIGTFDMVILDTIHFVPGEILDILCLKNNLKINTIIVVDDINIESRYPDLYDINLLSSSCNTMLLSTIEGHVLLPDIDFPEIGAIEYTGVDPNKLLLCLCHKWNTDILEKPYIDKINQLYGNNFGKKLLTIYDKYKRCNFI